jgi:tRNA (guanine-N7-)-methyltransferase
LGKNKLKKFAEMETFDRVFQPGFDEFFEKQYNLKGQWAKEVFENNHPIVLELGCGKGEYTIALAEKYSDRNFLGIDIKGARLWTGARIINERNIRNAAFLRTRIEFINAFFDKGEIHEIWITFPDPQLKKRRNKKRLTGSIFLNYYRRLLIGNGCIHLKTDNTILFEYTRDLVNYNHLEVVYATNDLYKTQELPDQILSVQTHYEKQFLEQGMTIKYICFRLPSDRQIQELPDDEE